MSTTSSGASKTNSFGKESGSEDEHQVVLVSGCADFAGVRKIVDAKGADFEVLREEEVGLCHQRRPNSTADFKHVMNAEMQDEMQDGVLISDEC